MPFSTSALGGKKQQIKFAMPFSLSMSFFGIFQEKTVIYKKMLFLR